MDKISSSLSLYKISDETHFVFLYKRRDKTHVGAMFGLLRWLWPKVSPREAPLTAVEEWPSIPWKPGDGAVLYKESPYKGTIRTGKVYTVGAASCFQILMLRADNGTLGYFRAGAFVRPGDEHRAVSKVFTKRAGRAERMTRRKHNRLIAAEYDDIMKAQELIGK